MTNADAILKVYDACAKTLAPVLENISHEQLHWKPGADSRSIHEIIRHLIRVDIWFLKRLALTPVTDDPGENADVAALNVALASIQQEMRSAVRACQSEADLIRKGPAADAKSHETLAEIVIHVSQHYMYHLAQIVYLRRAQDRDWPAPLHFWEEASYAISDLLLPIDTLKKR